jgi:hypothetical protein
MEISVMTSLPLTSTITTEYLRFQNSTMYFCLLVGETMVHGSTRNTSITICTVALTGNGTDAEIRTEVFAMRGARSMLDLFNS